MHPFHEEEFTRKTFVMMPDKIPKDYNWLAGEELMYQLKGDEWYCENIPVSSLKFTFIKQATLDGGILPLLSIKIVSKERLPNANAQAYAHYVLDRVIDKYERWKEDNA
jgi:hypothetical protein